MRNRAAEELLRHSGITTTGYLVYARHGLLTL
jgi:hypothetical protein